MDYRAIASNAAEAVGVLDEQGVLMPLDSLAKIDLIIELERLTGLRLATAFVKNEDFASLDSISTMLTSQAARAKAAP